MTGDAEEKAFKAFETLVRMFVTMAYLGLLFVVLGIVLLLVLHDPVRLIGVPLIGCGLLMIFVGLRERRRGNRMLAQHRANGTKLTDQGSDS